MDTKSDNRFVLDGEFVDATISAVYILDSKSLANCPSNLIVCT